MYGKYGGDGRLNILVIHINLSTLIICKNGSTIKCNKIIFNIHLFRIFVKKIVRTIILCII